MMVRSPTRLLLTRTAANVPILSSPSCFLDMLGYFLDHLHLGVLLNDGSMAMGVQRARGDEEER